MPHQPSLTEIRFNNIVTCLRGAVTTVEIISKALETPFLPAIASTMKSLLLSVQSVKKHHGDCARMMEQIHELLYAIIRLHVGSDTSGELSPNMLKSLGMFTETLHKVHNFVEAQQDKNTIRQFFRRHEMNTLLKDCDSGLEQALNVFKVFSALLWARKH
ncbi:hypothetical protein DFH09DRAFT_1079313 [Mycena vulgaris]|nr:hypothetical protein DFH09DRAFT_1079313 [Mycena vulgaris]